MFKEILSKVDTSSGQVIVDAGCGNGDFSEILAKNGAKVFGLDNSDFFSKDAIERSDKITFIKSNLDEALPLENNKVDTIICINVLYLLSEYLDNNDIKIPRAIFEFNRILKDGGKLIIVTPQKPGYSQLEIAREHFKLSKKQHGTIKTYVQLFAYLIPILIVVIANWLIQQFAKRNVYTFHSREELETYFTKLGFSIESSLSTYSRQNLFIVGKKHG